MGREIGLRAKHTSCQRRQVLFRRDRLLEAWHFGVVAFCAAMFIVGCGAKTGGEGSASAPPTPTVSSITVAPQGGAPATTDPGEILQLTATAIYSDGSTQNVTSTATWTSSNTAVAAVSASGLLTSVAAGEINVSAALHGISGSDSVTVNAEPLSSIQVSPSNPTLAIGISQQFLAVGTYKDGTTGDITTSVTWSSTSPSSATVAASGVVTTVNQGTTSIVASSGAVSGSTLLTVPDVMAGLVVNTNTTDSLLATGTDSSGATVRFYGARDENGVPQSLYGISAQQTDGSVQSVALSSNGQLIAAYDTRGFNYSFLWSSATQGIVTLNTNNGMQSVSTPFDLGAAGSSSTPPSGAVGGAKTISTTAAPNAAPLQTHRPADGTTQSPIPGDVTVYVATSCGGVLIPETQATVNASLTSPSGYSYPELPINEQNGYYAADFPTLGVSAAGATVAAAFLSQLQSLCEAGPGGAGVSYIDVASAVCNALAFVVAPVGELEGFDPAICEGAIEPAEKICDAVQPISSWLDSYLNTPLTLSVNVSLGAATLPPENIQVNPATGLPVSMDFTFPCPTVSSVAVSPPSAVVTVGGSQLLHATALLANGQIIQSDALTWLWTPINSGTLSVSPLGSGSVVASSFAGVVGEAPGTATVTATEASSAKQGDAEVTVDPELSLTVTWKVTADAAGGWSGTDTLTISNGKWVYSGNVTGGTGDPSSEVCRVETGSGQYSDPAEPTSSAPFTFTLSSFTYDWINTPCGAPPGTGPSGTADVAPVTIEATPTSGGYTLSATTVYPPGQIYGGSLTTVTASGFLAAP